MIFIVYALLVGSAGLHLMHYYPLLPEKMATHFSGSGEANGWMSKQDFALFYIGFVLFMSVTFLGITALVARYPKQINIPNRNYWLEPERVNETTASLKKALLFLNATICGLFIAIHHGLIEINLKQPPILDNTLLFFSLGVSLAALAGFFIWCRIRFRKPDITV